MFPANSNYSGRFVTRFPSPVDGPGMALSVDVCKVPAPPAPFVPVPYPTPTTAWATSDASKQSVIHGLKAKLVGLNMRITNMCGGEPGSVHQVLDQYADTVSKLHVLMGPPMNVKVEGTAVKRVP